LKLSEEKSYITHFSDCINFLGYKIYLKIDKIVNKKINSGMTKFRTEPIIVLEAPIDKIVKNLDNLNFSKLGVGIPKGNLIHHNKEQIINIYNTVLRGILNYYSIANNRKRLISRIIYLL
jgi:hypothetical protein